MERQSVRQRQAKLSMGKLIKLDRQLSHQRKSGTAHMEVPHAVSLMSRVSYRCRFCNSMDSTNRVFVFDSGLVYCCETCGGRNPFSAQKAGKRQKYIKLIVVIVAVIVAAEFVYATGIGEKTVTAWKNFFTSTFSDTRSRYEDNGDDDWVNPIDEDTLADDATTAYIPTTATTRLTTSTTTQPSATRAEYPTDNLGRVIPEPLRQYASGLRVENRAYLVSLQESNWNINYRSSPQLIKKGEYPSNILGVIKSGSRVYVEYIYNDTWAVFQWDGRYVFASIYSSNDPTQRELMLPE